jgi:Tol biopolymer transport system component
MAAVVRRRPVSRAGDVYVRDLERGIENPLTFDGATNTNANVVWSPDNSHIAYSSGASRFELGAPPVVDPQPLFEVRVNGYAPHQGTVFYSVSSDGERFLISEVDDSAAPDINVVVNWRNAVPSGR